MLDLSLVPTDLKASFDRMAQQLFEAYCLRVGPQRYQLTELEFYYNTFDQSADNFAHLPKGFHQGGRWRLHGAGLDIVLAKEGQYYGGILLRGMCPLDATGQPLYEQYLDGPWRLAQHCLSQQGPITQSGGFYLEALSTKETRPFVCSPRVGLFLKQKSDLLYLGKPWRYTTLPLHTQRYRHLLYLSLRHQGQEAWQQLGLGARARANYDRHYQTGQGMQAEQLVGRSNSVQHTCEWLGYYHQHHL